MKRDLSENQSVKNRISYLDLFGIKENNKAEVLKIILETRKFEIDLYWKRTAFFWTLIGAAIAGYCLLLSKQGGDEIVVRIQFAIANLGLIFSVGWYFVNRGSKYWQLNWEKHLDVLEDDVIGPLFKTTISREYYGSSSQFFKLLAPFPFSVTKINQVLNLVIIGFWIIVLFEFSITHFEIDVDRAANWFSFYSFSSLGTICAIWSLIVYTQTGVEDASNDRLEKRKTAVNFDVRALENTD